jgi:hypothetical protein
VASPREFQETVYSRRSEMPEEVAEDVVAKGTCEGFEFHVDRNYRFVFDEMSIAYQSYSALQEAITRHIKDNEASVRKKLSIAVIDDMGTKRIVTGIHAGHGGLLVSPKMDRFSMHSVYHDVGWVGLLIALKKRLENNLERVTKLLKLFKVDSNPTYRTWSSSMHSDAVRIVNSQAERAKKACEVRSMQEALSLATGRDVEL